VVLETERSEISKTQRAEGVVPNRIRKCGRLICSHVDEIIVGLSICHLKIVTIYKYRIFFQKVVLSVCLAWLAP